MILSVSRRTDIPAFYSDWFMNRLHDGYVLVRNPMNYHQVSKVSLSPTVIDCIVFWTKNTQPMLKYLPEIIKEYPFYFQYTLNGYDRDVEPNLPSLQAKIETFKKLSDQIGPSRVIWRYDPVLLNNKYSVVWHIDCFSQIAHALKDYTSTCVFSFVDLYDKVKNNVTELGILPFAENDMDRLAEAFSAIARTNDMMPQTCAENIDLDKYGIRHGCCVDKDLIELITGRMLIAKKDKNQRTECGCLESIDIGQYNTCRHGCKYCYANFNFKSVETFSRQHNPLSPFLIGEQEANDKITDRKMTSLLGSANEQMSFL